MHTNKLVLGTVQFGLNYGINNQGGQVPTEEVKKILSIAFNNGILVLDTSSAYGKSESVLGNAFSNKQFKIVSKYPKCDLSVEESLKESLYRLKQEQLYGYLVHHFDYYLEKPVIFSDMLLLKAKEKIQKVGFSIYNVEQLNYLLDNKVDFDIIQFPYNIFDRQFEPFLPLLHEKGIEVHTRSAFLQGLFFRQLDSINDHLLPLKKYLFELHSYCESQNISIEDLSLNYVLNNEFIDGVLIGVDNSQQLRNNIDAAKKRIRQQDIDFVNSIKVFETELLNPVNWNK